MNSQTMEDIFLFTILFKSVLSISLNLRSVVLFVESKDLSEIQQEYERKYLQT